MSWTTLPAADTWHHLVYTYDGSNARVYADGAEDNGKAATLSTQSDFSINLAAQRILAGVHHIDATQQAGSLWLAVVRVHSEALTAADVASNYGVELSRSR